MHYLYRNITSVMFGIFALFLLAGGYLHAQVSISQPLPVLEGINQGSIQATVSPPLTIDSVQNVFDGATSSIAGVQGSNTLQITLAFSDSAVFDKSKVYFWNSGIWSLEIADTEDDLNSQTGSYELLVDQRNYTGFAWDSVAFSEKVTRYVRLTAENPQNNSIYIGEWGLVGSLNLTSLYVYPNPPKVIPGASLQLHVKALDDHNILHPYPLDEPIVWSVENTAIATINEFGEVQGVALGTTTVHAASGSGSISGSAPVSVLSDFQSTNAPTKTAKVALVIQDPVIDTVNNKRIHELWGWQNPSDLVSQIQDDFYLANEGVINFQIVEVHNDSTIFTRIDSVLMSMDTLTYYYTPSNNALYGHTPGKLQYLAETLGLVKFDYNYMIDYYDFDTKRNNGDITEVWVYGPPFAGMYESQLVGPGAFWYNSPPLDHPGLNKLLSVMGWNYERGVAEALHSFGHRVESTMAHAYGRWNTHASNPNSWEIFTRIDKDHPDSAHVGNVHYPPNGVSDYDYSNIQYVITYADNWKRYPYLLDQTRTVNCAEWNCSHRRYMRWWLKHLPRFEGVYQGILNNWWHYVVDYEEAVELADSLNSLPLGIENKTNHRIPDGFYLSVNYPNPFNPTTTISFGLPVGNDVTLKIFDVLGREVSTLIDSKLTAGEYEVTFDAKNLASGVYFYQLKTSQFLKTRKMLLLR